MKLTCALWGAAQGRGAGGDGKGWQRPGSWRELSDLAVPLLGSASGGSFLLMWIRRRLKCQMQAGNSCAAGESWRVFPVCQQEKDLLD